MRRHVPLAQLLAEQFPDHDAATLIADGRVLVNGAPAANLNARAPTDAAIVVLPVRQLRGATKLAAALDRFAVAVAGRVALDVGAAAGGFTSCLLERGARRVYAVDVGHGQLVGSLRQDPRVVNLESTNLAGLSLELVAEPLDVLTVDLSYLSLAKALPQLNVLSFAGGADLVALVKPMFELALPSAPTDATALAAAVEAARAGTESAGWTVIGEMESPQRGAGGAFEGFIHARR